MVLYLNPTLACQTKANKKKSTGITGMMSVSGPNTAKQWKFTSIKKRR